MYSLWNQQWVKAYPRDCFLKFMSAPSQKGGVVKTRRFLMLSYLTMKHAITFGSRMKRSRAELCFCVQGRGSFWGFPSLPPCSYPNIAVSMFGVGITSLRSIRLSGFGVEDLQGSLVPVILDLSLTRLWSARPNCFVLFAWFLKGTILRSDMML